MRKLLTQRVVVAFLSLAIAQSVVGADFDQELKGRVAEVLVGSSALDRAAAAMGIADAFQQLRDTDRARLADETVDAIASLLSHSDRAVRLWAANTLGMLGHRAQRAIGALRLALAQEKSRTENEVEPRFSTGLQLDSVIEAALYNIEGAEKKNTPEK
ncbi:MAG: HEAT repeat domain-containing protein [Alphaproteobacteria bacterium]|nr:HEAT repeat domain-containing protein [Alphaproteobacteria bacterium]